MVFLIPNWQLPRMPRFRLLTRRPGSEWALFITIFFYVIVCVFVYFWLVEPWISGQIDVRIGADSDIYWEFVRSAQRYGIPANFLGLTSNQLGPVTLGLLLKNGFAVMCFNIFLFCVALKVAFSFPGINKSLFGFLMLLNAELFPSLTTLNKEILALFAAVLTAKYIYSGVRSKLLLVLVSAACLFARWEELAILIMFLVLYRWKRPKLTLAVIIAAITVAYPLAINAAGIDLRALTLQGENGNTITFLNNIQAHYGFPFVLIPKTFMAFAGRLGAPWIYWSGQFLAEGFEDIQQQIFQPLGCASFLIVFTLAVIRGKMDLRRPIAFLVAITVICEAVTPFVQPRYLYGTYVLLCLEISLSQTDETLGVNDQPLMIYSQPRFVPSPGTPLRN